MKDRAVSPYEALPAQVFRSTLERRFTLTTLFCTLTTALFYFLFISAAYHFPDPYSIKLSLGTSRRYEHSICSLQVILVKSPNPNPLCKSRKEPPFLNALLSQK